VGGGTADYSQWHGDYHETCNRDSVDFNKREEWGGVRGVVFWRGALAKAGKSKVHITVH